MKWFHVPEKINPADLPSRGCSPKELLQSKWWEGPEWLKLPQAQWPSEEFIVNEEEVNVEKKKDVIKTVINNNVEAIENLWFARRSSYILCLRILAWIKRFVGNCRSKRINSTKSTGQLTMKEIFEAETLMVGLVQRQVFPENSNFINGLRVAKTEEGLYYVVTKTQNRQDTGRFNKPFLLSHTHPVVQKIIEETHQEFGHAGTQLMIAKLREKFWIIKTRLAVKKIINKCITCRRFKALPATVPISALPEN